MRFLRTLDESLNIAKINRIAYLSPSKRARLSEKTREPYWQNPDDGEIIVDVGRAIPLVLGYISDRDVGRVVVAMLTDLITSDGPDVIDYDDVVDNAEEAVERARAKADRESSAPGQDDDDDDLDDIEGFEAVGGWSREPEGDDRP